jgi:putative exosortase-associated protein (TIGR04073 family)
MNARLPVLLGLCLALLTPYSFAAEKKDAKKEKHDPARKLGRGLANVLFGAVEVPNQYTKSVAEHGGAAGVTHGVPKGVARWLGRTVVGVVEVVTFPVPSKPAIKPEWPNEDFEP